MKSMSEQLEIMFGDNGIETEDAKLARKIYKGKKVLFLVPLSMKCMGFQWVSLCLTGGKYRKWELPEKELTFAEQRLWVENNLLKAEEERHIVITTSPIILTDAFSSQIWMEKEDGAFRPCGFSTFGAEPGRVALHLMKMPEVIGSLSDKTMDSWLEDESLTKHDLEIILRVVGGGWPRARLREILQIKLDRESVK